MNEALYIVYNILQFVFGNTLTNNDSFSMCLAALVSNYISINYLCQSMKKKQAVFCAVRLVETGCKNKLKTNLLRYSTKNHFVTSHPNSEIKKYKER